MSYKFNVMPSMTRFDTIHTNCISIGGVAAVTSIEIMHWKGCITRDFVEALTARNGLFHFVLVIEDFIATRRRLNTTCQTEATKLVVENLIKF